MTIPLNGLRVSDLRRLWEGATESAVEEEEEEEEEAGEEEEEECEWKKWLNEIESTQWNQQEREWINKISRLNGLINIIWIDNKIYL